MMTSGRLMHRPLEHDAAEWTLRVKTILAKKKERQDKVAGAEFGMQKLMVSLHEVEEVRMKKARSILNMMGLGLTKEDGFDDKRGVYAALKAELTKD